MVCVYKLITKKFLKKCIGEEQDGTKDNGTISFCRGVAFLFLNQSFSLSMSKFLHLFSLVISCFKK